MATFRPIDSNFIRYIWEENPNLMQTDKNTLYEDYNYPNKYLLDIITQVQKGDEIWVQFRTDYLNIVSELIDCKGNKTTLQNVLIASYDNYNYYNVIIDSSTLSGYYYIRHSMEQDYDKPIAHFRTDWFEVKALIKDSLLIEWYGGDANEIPMIWQDRTQQLRVIGHMADYEGGELLNSLRGSDNNLIKISSEALNGQYLSIDNITRFMAEKLNIAITHDRFYVNGQEFGTEEPINIGERKGDTLTYSFQIKLEEKNYLNYASDEQLTGVTPVIPETSLAIDSETSLAIDSETSLKII